MATHKVKDLIMGVKNKQFGMWIRTEDGNHDLFELKPQHIYGLQQMMLCDPRIRQYLREHGKK